MDHNSGAAVTVTDRSVELDPEENATVALLLSETPDAIWIAAFHAAPLTRKGSLGFILAPAPDFAQESVAWTVPMKDMKAAFEFLEASVEHANRARAGGGDAPPAPS
jgi:hypothetical protein